jgi:hypothetical protein
MNTRIDTDELLIELFESGIDTDIQAKHNGFTIELSHLKNKSIIGIAHGETMEKALVTIIKKLADDSKDAKELRALDSGRFTRL